MSFILFVSLIADLLEGVVYSVVYFVDSRFKVCWQKQSRMLGLRKGDRKSFQCNPLVCCLAGLAGVGAHRSPCHGHVDSPGSVYCNRCLEGDSWAVTSPSHPDNRPLPARLSLADCVTVVGLRCAGCVCTLLWPLADPLVYNTGFRGLQALVYNTHRFCLWFTSSVTRLVSCLCRARVCVCVCVRSIFISCRWCRSYLPVLWLDCVSDLLCKSAWI